jgi:hypothetical protein
VAPQDQGGTLPEPSVEDEAKLAEIQRTITDTSLRATPFGTDACSGCEYYLDESQPFAYCWHPKLRILVSKDWWCQWYEERG